MSLAWRPPGVDIDQLKKFRGKAQHIYEELGQWGSDYYIKASIERLKRQMQFGNVDDQNGALLQCLQQLEIGGPQTTPIPSNGMQISEKVKGLIGFLAANKDAHLHGIVFVEQRATVAVLHKLLSVHPMTKTKFSYGTFVGTSNSASRKTSLGDLLDPTEQEYTLESFRKLEKNLIIATNVLEEGIDISACNLVICFNKPANLKSFIQRRGRARKEQSIFVLMLSLEDESVGPQQWENLERQMTEAYRNDAAQRLAILDLESSKEENNSRFEIKSTR